MSSPKWFEIATKLLGTKERVGVDSNPVILEWAKSLNGWVSSFYKDDSIPWCGLFVAHCLSEAGFNGPRNPLRALAWADWGVPTAPVEGAVLVFRRPGGGHVGFYVGETASAYKVRGGNQGDAVSDIWISKDRFVVARWPKDTQILTTKVILNSSGNLSANEV